MKGNNSTEIKCPIATSSKWMSKWNEQHCKRIKSLARKVQQTPLVQSRNHNLCKQKPPLIPSTHSSRNSPILQLQFREVPVNENHIPFTMIGSGRVGDLGKSRDLREVCWGLHRRVRWGWWWHRYSDFLLECKTTLLIQRAGPPPWAWLLLVVFKRILIYRTVKSYHSQKRQKWNHH